MTWISLVCLLALTSSALGRSAYGNGYGLQSFPQTQQLLTSMRDQTIQRPFVPTLSVATQGYGQQQQQVPFTNVPSLPVVPQQDTLIPQKLQTAYSSVVSSLPRTLPVQGYGGLSLPQFDQQQVQQVQQVQVLTEADMLCRGQQAETVIPQDNGRKFIVCLADSKGVEQFCPKGLFYNEISRRCERKLGPLENVCVSQPCLNGGQCVPTDSHYQCQCAPGFDGQNCELDARVCQTQQPCGQGPDVRCQSFRLGAALQYICILQDGLAYGLNAQQVQPSPCQGVDGPQSLAVSDKGFIMCDGERMFVESCPGGTIWDDINKACTWPDMQIAPQLEQTRQGYGQSYGDQRTMIPKSGYGAQIPPQQLEQPRQIQSYGVRMSIPQQLDLPRPVSPFSIRKLQYEQPKQIQSYDSRPQLDQSRVIQSLGIQQRQFEQPKQIQSYDSQPQLDQSRVMQSFGTQQRQFEQPKLTDSYGGQQQQLEQPRVIQSFGTQQRQFEQPKLTDSYGGQQQQQQQLEQPRVFQSYGIQQQPQQDDSRLVKQSSGY